MNKLKKHRNACAPLALCYISGIDNETVLRVCIAAGFDFDEGMYEDDIIEAANELEMTLERVKYLRKPSLAKFIETHTEGLYLILTIDHALCIDNGLIYDPRCPGEGGGRKIYSAYKVIKSM